MLTADPLPLDSHRLRADFPILSQLVHGSKPLTYLDNVATTQHPQSVIEAITRCYQQQYANVHRGIHALSEQSSELYEQARSKIAQFIGAAHPHEVVFTSGTTASLNLIARSWGEHGLTAGDEILLTEMEHHSNIVPWQQLAEKMGARVRFIPISDQGELELSSLDQLLNERTKMVALAAVSNVLGTINPVKEVTKRAHAAGALVTVDAAQHVPHGATDVVEWDADFVAFSGHKMLGPSGVGVLYGREALLESIPPFLGGGSMISSVTLEGFTPGRLPAKFEAGTPPIVPAIGFGAAIDYLNQVGMDQIAAYERLLVVKAHQVLQQFEGLRILGPAPEKKACIISFTVDRVSPLDIAFALDRHGIAVRAGHHCAMPLHQRYQLSASTRISFYLYNLAEEIDRLAECLRQELPKLKA